MSRLIFILVALQMLCFISCDRTVNLSKRSVRTPKLPKIRPSNVAIPEMRAPVFRLSHTSSGVYADKLKSPYQSDKKEYVGEETEYDDEDNTKEGSEEEEYSEADEVQYYEDTTPLPPLHVIDAEL